MIKTYEIDLDDSLVSDATKIFDNLGTDIDSAVSMFLKQAVLRNGFPFELVIPENAGSEKLEVREDPIAVEEKPCEANSLENDSDLHGGVSDEEEDAFATSSVVNVPPVSAEVAARVAANEALVAQMRNEIGDKAVTPEFDENEDDGTHGDYDSTPAEETKPAEEYAPAEETEPAKAGEPVSVEGVSEETAPVEETEPAEPSAPEDGSEEDEDETTPDNLFDAWDIGDEEEIGCR